MARVRWQGTGGLELAGETFGDPHAAPVVLLHGGGQTRHAWGGTGRALGDAGFHAVALDLRGHGDSAWAPDGNYLLEAFADDLLAVARNHLGRPTAVVGASLGGLASLIAQEQDASWVSAVVLVDVAPRMDPGGVARIVAFMSENMSDGFATLDEAADAIGRFLPNRKRPKILDGLSKNLRQAPDGRYRWHWDPAFIRRTGHVDPAMSLDRLSTAASKLSVPTLLVRGKLSDVLTEAAADEFLAIVPHAEFVDVAEAAHMIAGDKNDVFGAAVVDFLVRALSA